MHEEGAKVRAALPHGVAHLQEQAANDAANDNNLRGRECWHCQWNAQHCIV